MSANPLSLWVYLSQSPLLWLTVTLLVYAIADAASLATHRHALANPVLHSIWIIGVFLLLTGTILLGLALFLGFFYAFGGWSLRAPADLEGPALRHEHHRRDDHVAVVLDQLDAIADQRPSRGAAGAEVDAENDVR